MLNMCSKQDFIPFTLITCYSHCDTDTHNHGSQEFIPNFSFTCRQFDMVEISNDRMCVILGKTL